MHIDSYVMCLLLTFSYPGFKFFFPCSSGTYPIVGVDVLGSDRLGKLGLTREGSMSRNRLVYKFIRDYMQGTRLVITMGGGYPKDKAKVGINTTEATQSDAFQEIVAAHQDVYISSVEELLL